MAKKKKKKMNINIQTKSSPIKSAGGSSSAGSSGSVGGGSIRKATKSAKGSKSTKGSKTNKPKLTPEQKQARREYLAQLRADIMPKVEEANKRLSQLREQGLEQTSQAFQRAYDSLPTYRKGDNAEIFRADLRSEKTLQKEAARLDQFLGDWSSTPEGASYYRAERLEGAFGGQWLSENGQTFDTSRVNEDLAALTFGMYDRLAEKYQSEDRLRMLWNKDGHAQDSDKLIIALYSMVEEGHSEEDVFLWASQILDQNYEEMLGLSQRQFVTNDYGRLN